MGNDGAEEAKRLRGPLSRAPQISLSLYRVATYAVTSIVTATISASGLVHFMFSSSQRVVEPGHPGPTDDWVLAPSRIVGGPDDARSNAGGVPEGLE
jgi:hypothetical protein